jgi:hypothetical protein
VHCPECGWGQEDAHRFCVSCGTRMPLTLPAGQLPKVTQMFLGLPTHAADPPSPVLRASHYLRDIDFAAPEGIVRVPGDHVRISIWPDDRPVCAMSLSLDEAARLGRFLLSAVPQDSTEERLPT